MNDRELEDLMRDYEAEVAAYKRLPQAEPTALLDRAVLTKARAAIGHTHRPPRWIALAASFAGVAIAAGIGWRVYEAQQASHEALLQDRAARGEAFEVEVLPSSSRDRAKALEMAQMPPPPPPPPAEAPKDLDAFADRKQLKERVADAPPAAAAPVVAEEALAAPVVSSPAPQRAAEPEPHKRADHGARGAVPEQRQNQSAPASAASGASIGLADADDQRAAKRERNEADAELGGLLARSKEDAPLSAEAWLEQIRTLVRDRKYARARSELVRFRQIYPSVVIPADLRRYAP